MAAPAGAGAGNVVLVHGGFVDGSGWEGVYAALEAAGRTVVVQNPTTSLADDVAATKRPLAELEARYPLWATRTEAP